MVIEFLTRGDGGLAAVSYISVIDRYHEYRDAIHELLGSIVTGIAEARLLRDEAEQDKAIAVLVEHYPFVDMMFTLDCEGVQVSDNVGLDKRDSVAGKGKDRSHRPYFILAKESTGVTVTDPYLSSTSGNLCISASMFCGNKDKDEENCGYVVLDIDLAESIEYLMGDTLRQRFEPVFKAFYVTISLGLFVVVLFLLYYAFSELITLFKPGTTEEELQLKPFGVIIFLTLALAIFDLGKTTIEEEVLMHKDIFRHSSTRRTITRFIAAIVIAVSIESLLLLFKGALGKGEHMDQAVWMMMASVGMLIGLGVYVYLGAKAEAVLQEIKFIGGNKRKQEALKILNKNK